MDKVTLGGDRLGAGGKQQIMMHGFERSTHDLSYGWRSTMSAGTLVPFMVEIGLPGDTFDIELFSECLTHPTVGPLFGSYKAQYDVFRIPLRLYNSWLLGNKLNIGNNMSAIKLPALELTAEPITTTERKGTEQINPSSLLAYLGMMGVGETTSTQARDFFGVPMLMYWDIYKNYYANLQEEVGAVIHADNNDPDPIIDFEVDLNASGGGIVSIGYAGSGTPVQVMALGAVLQVTADPTVGTVTAYQCMVNISGFGYVKFSDLVTNLIVTPQAMSGTWNYAIWGNATVVDYRWVNGGSADGKIKVVTFPLTNVDDMREAINSHPGNTTFYVNLQNIEPYSWADGKNIDNKFYKTFSQEMLGIKTYQSDLFNNWLNTAWINNVTAATRVSTSGGSFTIDELNMKQKVWELLNRIAVSGGSYKNWMSAAYDQKLYGLADSPIYEGGMIKELVFQEVISNAATSDQPLGTLAGRGKFGGDHKGGKMVIKCDEHSVLMGIVSLTPRLDYSQGNRWFTHLENIDELHKPSLDQIGFQDLITEQMAWFDTRHAGVKWTENSAGKQPAWVNYMTNYNRVYGNFAEPDNEMFMTLNRRYEWDDTNKRIKDLTTYIDPAKFNFIFADTSLDSQNFWMQIGVKMEVRRKISAKIMPNL